MTKEERRISMLILEKYLRILNETQEIGKEIQKVIIRSTDNGEIRRLRKKFEQMQLITEKVHTHFNSIEEDVTKKKLHLVEPKK